MNNLNYEINGNVPNGGNMFDELKDIAYKLRIDTVRATNASKSGHPTSCSSIAEIMSVLFFKVMKYRISDPLNPSNDRFILSKGHAAPILYAAWARVGLFSPEELLNLRKFDSDLEGHPTPRLKFVDVATGSLGQGMSIACGMALVGKYFDGNIYRVYCIVGDGESAEGSIWEAMQFAGHYKLNNLVVIFDVNRLGQSDPTPLQHDMDTYQQRAQAFGFCAYIVDGHDIPALCGVFEKAMTSVDKPVAILAHTFKGKELGDLEDKLDWHGKPLGEKAEEIIEFLQKKISNPHQTWLKPRFPEHLVKSIDISRVKLSTSPNYNIGQKFATRQAYGVSLKKIAENHPRVVAFDGDTKNSTYSEMIKKADPFRYVECFIAEQNMIGVAIGAACRNRCICFCSTFAAFFSRAFDQLRMGAISKTNINCVGSHAGISIGEDGPSQMGLEDIALFRSLPGSTVFYPSDAVSTEYAVELAANTPGICYIRTTRPATPVIYSNNEIFEIGHAKIVMQSSSDQLLIVAAGVTLEEAMKAANTLKEKNIFVRVMDLFTIKPIDSKNLCTHASQCFGRVLTVEDHYPEGGLGEAVQSALSHIRCMVVRKLAVESIPRSGPPSLLLEAFKISASCIVQKVLQIIAED